MVGPVPAGRANAADAAPRRGPSQACLSSRREKAPAEEPPLRCEELPPVLAPREESFPAHVNFASKQRFLLGTSRQPVQISKTLLDTSLSVLSCKALYPFRSCKG